MRITDRTIAVIQFTGVCLSVCCMLAGGCIYLYNFAWQPVFPERPLATTVSKALLICGVWLLINMQLVRVFMACYMFFKAKENILGAVSGLILVILFVSLYFYNVV